MKAKLKKPLLLMLIACLLCTGGCGKSKKAAPTGIQTDAPAYTQTDTPARTHLRLERDDWADDVNPGGTIGARRMFNHVNLRLYYIEGEEELRDLKRIFPRQGA